MAEGGGDLTVVSLVLFEFTVLLVVDSVTIGCAIAALITRTTPNINNKFFNINHFDAVALTINRVAKTIREIYKNSSPKLLKKKP